MSEDPSDIYQQTQPTDFETIQTYAQELSGILAFLRRSAWNVDAAGFSEAEVVGLYDILTDCQDRADAILGFIESLRQVGLHPDNEAKH